MIRLGALDREIVRLALPALGALAIEPLVSMTDTAFVGRLGAEPLAALGITTALLGLFFVVFNFLAYATTPRVARSLGAEGRTAAMEQAGHALWLALLLGLAATAVLELLAPWLVRLMGAEGSVYPLALGYLRLRALAGLAILWLMAAHGIYRGLQDTRTPFWVTFWVNAANVLLDYLFIFPLGMGLMGAALASVLAQSAGAVWFYLSLRRLGAVRPWPGPAPLLPFLKVGGEMLVRTLSLVGAITLAAAVAARVGTVAVAAHQVVWQIWLFVAMSVDALAIAAQALVARYRGEDPVRARRVADRLLAWGLVVGVLIAVLLALGSPWIPRVFTNDAEVLAAVGAVWALLWAPQPLNALVFVWDGIFMAAERFRFLAAAMLLAAGAGALEMLLVVPQGWGLAGVWWGMILINAVRAATLAWGYWRTRMV
ncbi:MATE family efflux transporter [Oceanithermus sp.]